MKKRNVRLILLTRTNKMLKTMKYVIWSINNKEMPLSLEGRAVYLLERYMHFTKIKVTKSANAKSYESKDVLLNFSGCSRGTWDTHRSLASRGCHWEDPGSAAGVDSRPTQSETYKENSLCWRIPPENNVQMQTLSAWDFTSGEIIQEHRR